MPIPIDSLNKNFIVVQASATVAEVCDQVKATKNHWTYVVVRFADEYAILRIAEIIELLQKLVPEPAEPVSEFPLNRLLDSANTTKPLDQATVGRAQAERLVKAAPRKRLAVVSGEEVMGVLAFEARSADAKPDYDWLDCHSIAPPASATLPESAPDILAAAPKPNLRFSRKEVYFDTIASGAGSLGAEPPVPGGPTVPATLESSQPRFINAEILDHDAKDVLQLGQVYTLAFDVDVEQRAGSLVQDAAFTYKFSEDEDLVELTVQLSSNDVTIHTEPQKLKVPRTGRSKGRARFDIEPLHEGECVINAVFLKEGNFIQLLMLKLNIGKAKKLESKSLSRPLEAAFDVQPRDLALVITNTGTAFKLIMTGPVYAEATLSMTLPQLDQAIAQVRAALRQVVNFEVGPNRKRVYQQGVDIPEDVNRAALKHLAETGFLLFQQMFYGDAADAQSKLLGDKLIEMSQQQRLKIQIVSQQFLLPWGLLYLVDDFDADNIDPERFLGLKHIIEHIPLQPSMQVVDSVISSQPEFTVSLNVNTDIDQEMGMPLIAEQLNYWQQIADSGQAKVIVRKTGEEIEKSLGSTSTNEQILYFYCHAVSQNLSEGGGPDASTLKFSGKALTLRDLKLRAPTKRPLSGAPLVFINACESAELSPLFYGGFVPYFMAKGARGVIGTECETPAIFAREWARRFFESFLAGKSLGNVFLNLRREFFFQHNNVMGLLYAVYCDGDTRVFPGVQINPQN